MVAVALSGCIMISEVVPCTAHPSMYVCGSATCLVCPHSGVSFINYVEPACAIAAMHQLHGTRISEGRHLHITLQAPRAVRAAAAAAAAAASAAASSSGTIAHHFGGGGGSGGGVGGGNGGSPQAMAGYPQTAAGLFGAPSTVLSCQQQQGRRGSGGGGCSVFTSLGLPPLPSLLHQSPQQQAAALRLAAALNGAANAGARDVTPPPPLAATATHSMPPSASAFALLGANGGPQLGGGGVVGGGGDKSAQHASQATARAISLPGMMPPVTLIPSPTRRDAPIEPTSMVYEDNSGHNLSALMGFMASMPTPQPSARG